MFEFKSLCFHVVYLVHDVRTIHGLCYLLPVSGTLIRIMGDSRATANCSFADFFFLYISEKISRCCSQLRKVKYRLKSCARSNIAATKYKKVLKVCKI